MENTIIADVAPITEGIIVFNIVNSVLFDNMLNI